MSSRSESGAGAASSEPSGRRFGGRGDRSDDTDPSVRTPSREDVLRTVFGLGTVDVRTYDAVVEAPGSTTTELADQVDRDRSNVNRSLTRLREAGLATRTRRLLDDGGHVYQYYATADETTGGIIAQAVDRWRSAALDAVVSE